LEAVEGKMLSSFQILKAQNYNFSRINLIIVCT
jgi:hypothetical protein